VITRVVRSSELKSMKAWGWASEVVGYKSPITLIDLVPELRPC